MRTIGHVVKPFLKKNKMTQQELADRMSISRQQVNEILKRAETSDEVIEKIEGILKMQDELLPFRIKNYAQTAYGMVVIQNQHETKEIYERLISELKERILEQSKVIEILSQQLKSKKSTQT